LLAENNKTGLKIVRSHFHKLNCSEWGEQYPEKMAEKFLNVRKMTFH